MDIAIKDFNHFMEECQKPMGKNTWFRGTKSLDHHLKPNLFWKGLEDQEGDLVHDFLVSYKAIIGHKIPNPWELYVLMQHHGLPTRLLDWTKSPLIALYFSLEDHDSETNANDAAVWAISPYNLNKLSVGIPEVYCPDELSSSIIPTTDNLNLNSYLPRALDHTDSDYSPPKPIAIEPSLSNSRINAQSGCFTVHGKEQISIDDLMQNSSGKIKRLLINKKHKREFQNKLFALGFTEDFIYQDLDSLSERIVRMNSPNIDRNKPADSTAKCITQPV